MRVENKKKKLIISFVLILVHLTSVK